MHTIPCMTEDQVLAAIEEAVRVLAPQFKIPGYAVEDVAQEARIMGMECLCRYDPQHDANGRPTRPLVNFLFGHIRRRLHNLRRDKFKRSDAPCRQCHSGEPHEPTRACDIYRSWLERNTRRAQLAIAYSFDQPEVAERAQPGTDQQDEATLRDMRRLIDEHLPLELRRDFLMLVEGRRIDTRRRQMVVDAVKEILGEAA